MLDINKELDNETKRKLVDALDGYSQDNNESLDRKFAHIYRCAHNQNEGWKGIQMSEPTLFARAFELVLENASVAKHLSIE